MEKLEDTRLSGKEQTGRATRYMTVLLWCARLSKPQGQRAGLENAGVKGCALWGRDSVLKFCDEDD